MFGISKEKLEVELEELHDRIGDRLFGRSGKRCLNLYKGEGVLGKMEKRMQEMEDSIDELEDKVDALKPKSKKKKKVVKKK